ncbi:hypothetical protein IC620_06560 [Hazenella sp. IB182357]|uniref:Uncharacterized protein n=1 Tax=Polycladospora coralii TaxID=2771432 RepID=A0A926N8E5_9BACL|nr:hypothetical protein [Polycladospora coralii]MBD1372021.1 hypothetical protein [Polycladospora coralii]MBS7530527.1 hypothetical protein [Polycladospora coralii]
MMHLQITGTSPQVQTFLCDLEHRKQVEVVEKSCPSFIDDKHRLVRIDCHIKHLPARRQTNITLRTTDGKSIHFPLLDVIQVEISPGVKLLTGRVTDVFS